MTVKLQATIAGTGIAHPERAVDNAFFEDYLDTSDEWIRSRTGIRQRYFANDNETTVSLASDAARAAIADAGLQPADIGMIILATVTPDTWVPAGACWLQNALGLRGVPAFDINAACAGLAYGLVLSGTIAHTGTADNILVVGAETLSRITDMQDRGTCILFGDGAAAVIMRNCASDDRGIIYHDLGADGSRADYIHMPGGGSREPVSSKVIDERLMFLRMRGREVYKFAVQRFNESVDRMLAATGIHPEEIDMIVPHQSNLRIIDSVREKLNLPAEKFAVNIDRFGNTSSASIGLALHEARASGRIKDGDLIMMIGLGAGLTWGVILLRV